VSHSYPGERLRIAPFGKFFPTGQESARVAKNLNASCAIYFLRPPAREKIAGQFSLGARAFFRGPKIVRICPNRR
jgi:hypothetical protein